MIASFTGLFLFLLTLPSEIAIIHFLLIHQISLSKILLRFNIMVVQPLFAFLLTCSVLHAIIPLALSTCDAAYPSPYGLDSAQAASGCGSSAPVNHDLIPVRREVYGGGRIIDISHRYNPDMPSWGSDSGIGQFLWLPKSMKNGSLANNSEMKLPTHTGTHVDAPGHVFDHYFDVGFDVDTLDLEVLNGGYLYLSAGQMLWMPWSR